MKKKIAAFLTLTLLLSGCSTAVDNPDGGSETNNPDSMTSSGSSSDSMNSSGSSSESITSNDAPKSDAPSSSPDLLTLKWGVCNLGSKFDQSLVSDFNEALHKLGYDFNVEFIDLYNDQYFNDDNGAFNLRQAITDYEENKGRLDIIDMAFSEGGIGLEGGQSEEGKKYDFISEGLLESLDIKKIMPENVFPDAIWDMERVNGSVYTLPSLSMLTPKVLTFFLNTDYISDEQIERFDGSFEGFVDILSEQPNNYGRHICVLDLSQTYYGTSCVSSEFDFVQSLAVDYETKKAVNPFEHKLFLDFARNINTAYNNGLVTSNTNGSMNFSTYGGCFEYIEEKGGAAIAFICGGNISDDDIKMIYNTDPKKIKKFSSKKAYIKNESSGNIGISAFSEHKEQSLQLLNAICNDSDCAQALQNIGIYRPLSVIDAESFENSGFTLSPVAGYRISYTDVEEYSDIKVALYNFYDELCHAEDFDAKLGEINSQLKEMGIDEFVDRTNETLVKHGHIPNQ